MLPVNFGTARPYRILREHLTGPISQKLSQFLNQVGVHGCTYVSNLVFYVWFIRNDCHVLHAFEALRMILTWMIFRILIRKELPSREFKRRHSLCLIKNQQPYNILLLQWRLIAMCRKTPFCLHPSYYYKLSNIAIFYCSDFFFEFFHLFFFYFL